MFFFCSYVTLCVPILLGTYSCIAQYEGSDDLCFKISSTQPLSKFSVFCFCKKLFGFLMLILYRMEERKDYKQRVWDVNS